MTNEDTLELQETDLTKLDHEQLQKMYMEKVAENDQIHAKLVETRKLMNKDMETLQRNMERMSEEINNYYRRKESIIRNSLIALVGTIDLDQPKEDK